MNDFYFLYSGALRVFRDFSQNSGTFPFSYEFNAPKFDILKDKYKIENVAGDGSELEKVLNLMHWCHENVMHNGGSKDVEFIPKTSLDILDYAYGKGREYGVYCRLQAIVFTECCLALGIKSRILHCLPFSPNDFDTHVVSMVYLSELSKWIMLDATNDRYFVDNHHNILSPMEIRHAMAFDEEIYTNVPDPDDAYKTYMAKNLFYFKSLQINTFGSDLLKNQRTIYCVPAGFDVLDREIAYCQFAVKNTPEEMVEDWKKTLSEFENRTTYPCLSAESFFS